MKLINKKRLFFPCRIIFFLASLLWGIALSQRTVSLQFYTVRIILIQTKTEVYAF